MWILSWHCNPEGISWSGTQWTWKWLGIYLLSVGHYRSRNIDIHYSHLWRIQRDLDWCYWWFNKTFVYRKAKNYTKKIKATTGVKNVPSYIVGHYLGPDGILQDDSLCFISDDSSHYTSFLFEVQTMLAYCVKANLLHIKNYFTFMTFVEDSTKTTRNLWICVPISMVSALVLNGCFLQQVIANLCVMTLVEQLNDM